MKFTGQAVLSKRTKNVIICMCNISDFGRRTNYKYATMLGRISRSKSDELNDPFRISH